MAARKWHGGSWPLPRRDLVADIVADPEADHPGKSVSLHRPQILLGGTDSMIAPGSMGAHSGREHRPERSRTHLVRPGCPAGSSRIGTVPAGIQAVGARGVRKTVPGAMGRRPGPAATEMTRAARKRRDAPGVPASGRAPVQRNVRRRRKPSRSPRALDADRRDNARHHIEIPATGEVEGNFHEVVEVGSEPALRAPGAFGDDAGFPSRGEDDVDPIGLAEVAALQDDRGGLVQAIAKDSVMVAVPCASVDTARGGASRYDIARDAIRLRASLPKHCSFGGNGDWRMVRLPG